MIKLKGEIVYIGYTSQSLSARLNTGLKASGKNGYHGYQWKNASDQFTLSVFVFERELSGDREKDKALIEFYEAIEAELVYRFRAENGKWPRYQQEIHFNNKNRKRVLGIVEYIYGYCEEN